MPSSGVKTCARSEEHTSELQSHDNLVCRLLLEKKDHMLSRAGRVSLLCREGMSGRAKLAQERHDGEKGVPLAQGQGFFFKNPAPPEVYALSLHVSFQI